MGTNLYLCKVAMDIVAKHLAPDKNGVRIAEIDETSYRKMLWEHRPLTDFWRIGHGYEKKLEVNGVGYRVAKEGKKLVMNLGYSHPVVMEKFEGIVVEVPAPNKVIVSGIDKQIVGQISAHIRSKRPPEPYLGKGIKYAGEHIRRKAGKAGK